MGFLKKLFGGGKAKSSKGASTIAGEKKVGEITHFFPHIPAGVIKISGSSISVGDKLHFKGATTDFTQVVDSIQIEHEQVDSAKKGQEMGIKVKKRVRGGDQVYKL